MRQLLKSQAVRSTARVGSVVAALVVAFVAGGTALEAGEYEIEATRDRVILRTTSGTAVQIQMPVITRLGRHDADPDSELVFDKVGGRLLLSEFWFPDMDGYLVLSTPTAHEHRVLGGSRPHK